MGVDKLSTAGIVNYQKYDDFLAGNVAYQPAYEWLETTVVGSGGAASVTFSNLNSTYGSTYQHLQLRFTVRGTRSADTADLRLRINSSSSTYPVHYLVGNGSTVTSTSDPFTSIYLSTFPANTGTANSFAAGVTDFLDAFETTKNKTVRNLSGRLAANSQIMLGSGLLISTNAIDSISVFPNFDNIAQFSRFSLNGLRSA